MPTVERVVSTLAPPDVARMAPAFAPASVAQVNEDSLTEAVRDADVTVLRIVRQDRPAWERRITRRWSRLLRPRR